MGEKRFTTEEEEAVIEEIRLLLVRGYQRRQIQKVLQTRYERSERRIDDYIAKARERLNAFGNEPLKDHRVRLLTRAEWLFAHACQAKEINAKQAFKALEIYVKALNLKKEVDYESSTETTGLSAGLLEALQKGGDVGEPE